MANKLMEVKLSAMEPAKLDAKSVYLVGPEKERAERECVMLPLQACVALSHIPEAAPICDMMKCAVKL